LKKIRSFLRLVFILSFSSTAIGAETDSLIGTDPMMVPERAGVGHCFA
jgi:hypothetical protein